MNPELEERLSALLDGELSPEEETSLRTELDRSPELRQRLAELAAVGDALRVLPGPEASDDLKERLRARIAAESEAPQHEDRDTPPATRGPARRRPLQYAAVAAIAAGLSALVFLVNPEETADEPGLLDPRIADAGEPPQVDDAEILAQEDIVVTAQRRAPLESGAAESAPLDDLIPDDFLVPEELAAAPAGTDEVGDLAEADLDVIGVLDLLAALDELEGVSG